MQNITRFILVILFCIVTTKWMIDVLTDHVSYVCGNIKNNVVGCIESNRTYVRMLQNQIFTYKCEYMLRFCIEAQLTFSATTTTCGLRLHAIFSFSTTFDLLIRWKNIFKNNIVWHNKLDVWSKTWIAKMFEKVFPVVVVLFRHDCLRQNYQLFVWIWRSCIKKHTAKFST